MTSNIRSNVVKVAETFSNAGFETINCDLDSIRFCFDVIANKMPKTVITKVVPNIDSISEKNILELKIIAYYINAIPLIIGKENRRNELEDNAVYYRKDIAALNLETLYNLLINHIHPYMIAKRGSYISQVDGNIIKEARNDLSLSRKMLAQQLGLSTKTISDYERGFSKSNVKHVEQMEKIFGIRVTIPINIFKKNKVGLTQEDLKNNKPVSKKKYSGFLDELCEIFEEMGLNQLWMQKSPFDVFLSLPTGEQMGVDLTESFISSVFPSIDKKDENANKDRLALISKMMNAIRLSGTAFVEDPIDAKKCKLAHIPVIEKKELKEVKNPKEFKKLVRKKI